jgi:uncharacterized protein YcbK (DUF882 family)
MTHFEPSETRCHCGCGMDITEAARDKFDKLREAMGVPLVVTSGARCATHNKLVGGAPASRHLRGDALDLSCTPALRLKLVHEALKLGAKGVGIGSSFIHVDFRPDKDGAIWSY